MGSTIYSLSHSPFERPLNLHENNCHFPTLWKMVSLMGLRPPVKIEDGKRHGNGRRGLDHSLSSVSSSFQLRFAQDSFYWWPKAAGWSEHREVWLAVGQPGSRRAEPAQQSNPGCSTTSHTSPPRFALALFPNGQGLCSLNNPDHGGKGQEPEQSEDKKRTPSAFGL